MKKNTLSAILMTLFLFISCNNSGKDGNSASTNPVDESVKGPNLIEISKKITDSNAVVLAVQEVETLLASIDEIAKKAIGQRIAPGNTLTADASRNGSLIVGVYTISTLITGKLNGLKDLEDLKEKIEKAKKCSTEFTKKLLDSHAELGQADGAVTDDNAKRAILKTHNNTDKGAKELKDLSESVESLAKAAKEMLNNAVKELTKPVVTEAPKKP
ncbi:Vsp/OspC family lipoprotein [Borreliella andersonii]|nr:Vsp/OspC family lipoprotein [Borreliella andersonii]WNY69982.1 Vsp/OspC family lipoprotein [Borreliella andersonii]